MVLPSEVGTPATATNNPGSTDTTQTISHTLDAAADIVVCFAGNWRSGGTTVSGVTYDGVAMTLLISAENSSNERASIYYMLAADLPSSGTYDCIVTTSSLAEHQHIVAAFQDANQTTPFTDNNSATGSSTQPAVSVTSDTDELVLGQAAFWSSSPFPGATSPETEIASIDNGGNNDSNIALRRTGASGSTEINPDALSTSRDWTMVAGSLQGVAAAGGGSEGPATFIRRPIMALVVRTLILSLLLL